MQAHPTRRFPGPILARVLAAGLSMLGVALLLSAQPPRPSRGIAVLASSIGREYPVDALVDFVEKGRFSPVVIDWAWITAHWGQTDFAEVNRLIAALAAKGVETPAMYRPRFLGNPTVPTQVKADGTPAMAHGYEICFSSAEARRWGAAWGDWILEKCPGIREIIIYHPRNLCDCPACAQAKEAHPFAPYGSAWAFLSEARALWRARRPDVKLGVVFGADPQFWSRGEGICDVAHPYLYVIDSADFAKDMAAVSVLRSRWGRRLGPCLAKVTWGDTDKVAPGKLADFDHLARQNALPYFLWTFDTLFLDARLYDPPAVSQALGLDWSALRPPLTRVAAAAAVAEALTGNRVTFTLVKDFMRVANDGPELQNVQFDRYFPAVDSEQVVLARWLTARSDAGEVLPISVDRVTPDVQGNLVHTYRLGRFPANQQALVTVTTLVARRERPVPQGAFPIPAPEAYPAEVRPFLATTNMVARDHPEIRHQADQLLAKSHDAYEVAQALAQVMAAKPYLSPEGADRSLPAAVFALRYGGSCCISAVCAAAVLRACGIPTQLTYCCGIGYIHGITQFYLKGCGWVRMDSTCGVGKLPLVQEEADLGLVRLYDMPIEMEAQWVAYAWPYQHNDLAGRYEFRAGGKPCAALHFAMAPVTQEGAPEGRVEKPFRHYECGSWNRVLGGEPLEGTWRSWDSLAEASRAEVLKGTVGGFPAVMALVPGAAPYVARGPEVKE